jgi:DNA-binding transcriptional ArsR family regulator
MSIKGRRRTGAGQLAQALVFAAMGDKTRLALVARLSSGQPASIARLTSGSRLTRQAITKHLRVLEHAGIVRSVRCGRESLYQLAPQPFEAMRDYLSRVSLQWDAPLARLKSFVEE